MAGFIRRYPYVPGNEVITLVEGVIVIDQTPPGPITGLGTGVAALIGEFADCTFATSVDASGVVSTNIRPQECFTSADMIDKVGGFDETIGEFGISCGNGFVELRNKRFSRLVCIPVNIASAKGVRYFRDLPMNTSQLIADAVVPVQGATVQAGREFRSGVGRLRIAAKVQFTSQQPIDTGIGGSCEPAASAVTQTFNMGNQAAEVWQTDVTGPTYVSMLSEFNSSTPADLVPFPAVDGVGDYFAVGYASTFSRLQFNNAGGTAGTVGTGTWEYWNGAAWTALSGVVDGTTGFTAVASDAQIVTWTVPTDWATTTINAGTALYFVRFVLTGVYTVQPAYDQGFVANLFWDEILREDGTLGAHKGDILVIGYNSGGTATPANHAGTYRVQTDPAADTVAIVVERLDGAAFTWTAQANVPWRLHLSSDADSAPVMVPGSATPGGYSASEVGGYTVPSRPITDLTGAQSTGSWTAALVLTPETVPTPLTGSSWDPLSGLGARLMPGGSGGITFTQPVQGINVAGSSSLDALYSTAIDALQNDELPTREINIVWSARKRDLIRTNLRSAVLLKSENAVGCVACVSPLLTTTTLTTVGGDSAPGVGATRDERVCYSWPGAQTFVPEAVNYRLKVADGTTVIDGIMDTTGDGWLAAVLSNLAPERNPGQSAEPVKTVLAPILGIQRGVTGLQVGSYIYMRSRGIVGLKIDAKTGPGFVSGVTSSLTSGEKEINRRRFADYVEDTAADRLIEFSKLPVDQNLKDGAVGELAAWLDGLLSINNPSAQRISGYVLDDKSGNTPQLAKLGVFVIIGKVEMMPMGNFIVFQAQVGSGVLDVTAG